MFDTMTMVKVMGGLCGTFLVFLLGGWAAQVIYEPEAEGEEQAYVIEIPDTGGAEAAPVEEGPPFEELLAAADPAAGQTSFARACGACHKAVEGENATGPYLWGVVGRDVDAVAGYDYSGALEEVAEVWTPENINAFITAPQSWAPGTKMTYSGLSDPEARANVIAYLDSLDG